MALETIHAVTGRCACGRVTFSCRVEAQTALCSCDLCRRSSGSAFQAWVNGSRASLAVEGDLSKWVSSGHATRHFCTHCGTTLFLFEVGEPEIVEVATGTLDEPHGIMSARTSRAYASQYPSWGRPRENGDEDRDV